MKLCCGCVKISIKINGEAGPTGPEAFSERGLVATITKDEARAICARHGDRPDALIEILHDVQESCGYVPRESVADIADALNITRAEVFGVITFYHDFRERPRGRRVIELCRAEACQAVGCRALADMARTLLGVDFGEATPDGEYELKEVYCLGNCALAPAARIDGKLFGRISAERLTDILSGAAESEAS